ncbi:MAG: endopeptidase La [Planctomycetota bacterium]|nr:endopeptidase La [Planctomycetota bacterium]
MTQEDDDDRKIEILPPGESELDIADAAEEVEEAARSLPAPRTEPPPQVLVAFPLRRSVPFPSLIMPVHVEEGPETDIMEKALAQGKMVGLLPAPGADGPAMPTREDQFSRIGVLAEVHKRIRLPDGASNYICRGLKRFQVTKFARLTKVPVIHVEYPQEVYPGDQESEALVRNVLALAQKVAAHNPGLGEGFSLAALNIEAAGHLADFCAAYLIKSPTEKRAVLEQFHVRDRLRSVDEYLTRELVSLELGDRIQAEIRSRVEKQQKEYFLREQIKVIRRELGEEKEPQEQDRENFLKKLEEGVWPAEVERRVRDEVERLGMIPQASPEYSVVRGYLDWLVGLPWSTASEDRIDLERAERTLDRDHFGLKEAKERILEFLGVRKLRPQHRGAILCFSGPPGVGKTSLAMALAESMGRKLERMSLGGMRDEAEIKGHRRTYIGAMPGRILQMIKRAGTNNPVIVLDEVDKLGNDYRGDPSSALLEVLDPAQNHSFLDLYLDIPFDLSRVMFVATANVLSSIPGPLRDRMEVIELPGYIEEEKLRIAQRHLLPRQTKEHGLEASRLKLPPATVRALIRGWTREAGVRGLDKAIASLCRKRALELARRKRPAPVLQPKDLVKYLGPIKVPDEEVRLKPGVGVALGLAYTPYGGDVLEIECVSFPGQGKVQATGSLGDVMSESTRIAHAYLRAVCADHGLDCAALDKTDLHVHFPAGAVPKDGPSAGITVAIAMLSRLTGRVMPPRTAMTGEISLTGEVLPVGGIREKVLGAKRQGVRTVILPAENRSDVTEMDPAWTRGMRFLYVERFEDVAKLALRPAPRARRAPRAAKA